jgi:hypothetical protein
MQEQKRKLEVVPGFFHMLVKHHTGHPKDYHTEPGLPEYSGDVKIWSDNHYLESNERLIWEEGDEDKRTLHNL